MKLAILVIHIFVASVLSLHRTKEVCKFSHGDTQAICSNFKIKLNENIDFKGYNLEKLFFKNVTGSLSFKNWTLLKDLTYFSISHSEIDNMSLIEFSNLKFLVLHKNKIVPNLQKEIFKKAEGINWLSVISNNHKIEQNSLYFLKNLSWLHIQNQKFEYLTGEFLREATFLHELTIRNCNLKKIDSDAFDNTPNLEILSLNFNKIKHFENGTFKNLKLKILELHHNKLLDLNFNQFLGLTNLEVLGLPSHFLKKPHTAEQLINFFPNLKEIEIKKKDLMKKNIQTLIEDLRKKKIRIIGTPHDCHTTHISSFC